MSYIYETKIVQKPRTSKSCSACGKDLPVGKPRRMVTWVPAEFVQSAICDSDDCYNEFAKKFDE